MDRYRASRTFHNANQQRQQQISKVYSSNFVAFRKKMSDWGDEESATEIGANFGKKPTYKNGNHNVEENGNNGNDHRGYSNGSPNYGNSERPRGRAINGSGSGNRRGGFNGNSNGRGYGGGSRNGNHEHNAYDEENEEWNDYTNRGSNGGGGQRSEGGFRRGGGRGGRGASFGGMRSGSGGSRDDGGGNRRYKDNNNDDGEPKDKPREFYIPPEPTDNENEIFSSGITSGINFAKYDKIPVKISGNNPPTAISTFNEANLRELIMQNVQKSGYQVPTPIQKTAIPIVAAGRDLMACAQTGSGKTAAYLLPIINTVLNEGGDLSIGKPQALIVSPTRELSIQIFNEARKFALGSYLKISIVYGGTSSKHQGENIAKGCHILICTPGRLLDFVERGFITFEETRFIVLDEADRMLDLGFKDCVERIMSHVTMRPVADRQTLMFSATFPASIQELAGAYLRDYIFVIIGVVGGACADVTQNIYEVKKFNKRGKLMEILNESAEGTIVFVETKRAADFLASLLSETEFPTTSIHGDRLQRQREQALNDFKTGKMKVLIATSVAARGLDIKNVNHVVNYDMPNSIDEYVHRIGRTGRVGNNGRATSFFDPDNDIAIVSDLVRILQDAGQEVPDFLLDYSSGNYAIGGGAFGDDKQNSKFASRDVRHNVQKTDYINSAGPAALEEEEDWG